MKEKLQNDLKVAMKSGDKIRLMTIRQIISEVTRFEKDEDVRRPANEAEIIQTIKKERARREESLEFARKGNRTDLIQQYEAEAKVLESYLPQAVGEEDVKAAIARHQAAGLNQIGPMMKALRDEFGPRLDSKAASDFVKQALAPK